MFGVATSKRNKSRFPLPLTQPSNTAQSVEENTFVLKSTLAPRRALSMVRSGNATVCVRADGPLARAAPNATQQTKVKRRWRETGEIFIRPSKQIQPRNAIS